MNWHPDQWHPCNARVAHVLVRPYKRPDRVGSVLLPEAYAWDHTWTLWEVVRAGEGAREWLDGYELGPQDILVTARRIPPFVGSYHEDRLFVLDLEQAGFQNVIRWEED